MIVKEFYHPPTYTLTFVVYDEKTRDAVIIDPVLDYDPLGSQTSTVSVEEVAAFIDAEKLRVHYVLETHAHADHLSGSQYLKRRFDARIAIGARITEVQETFKGVFDLPASFATDGSQFDRLLQDREVVQAGALRFEVLPTPGHTPACVSYKIEDAVFTGDALFIGGLRHGSLRFPAGERRRSLPLRARRALCPAGRDPRVRRPRLPARRPRPPRRDDDRPLEAREHPAQERRRRATPSSSSGPPATRSWTRPACSSRACR